MPKILFKEGEVRNPRGRPKGSQNKLAKAAKEVILAVAEMKGNETGLLEWMERDPKNEYAFWTQIYPKVLAQRVDLTSNGQPLMMRIEQVILQQGEDEEPIVEGVDYFEVPSTDPEIEARVQKESGRYITHEYNPQTRTVSEVNEENEPDPESYDNP